MPTAKPTLPAPAVWRWRIELRRTTQPSSPSRASRRTRSSISEPRADSSTSSTPTDRAAPHLRLDRNRRPRFRRETRMRTLLRRVAAGSPIAPPSKQIRAQAAKGGSDPVPGQILDEDRCAPADVASALTVLLTFGISYMTPAADDDLPPAPAAPEQRAAA